MLRRGRSLLLYSIEDEKRLLGRLEPGTEVSLQAGSRPRDFHHVSLEDEGRHYLPSSALKAFHNSRKNPIRFMFCTSNFILVND
jgi:hypothetical protein